MSTTEDSHPRFSQMLDYIASLASAGAVLLCSLSTLAAFRQEFKQVYGIRVKGMFRNKRVGLVLAYTWVSLALCRESALDHSGHDVFVSLKGVKNPDQRKSIEDLVKTYLPASHVKQLGQEWLGLDFAVVDADLNLLFACEAEMNPVYGDHLSTDSIEHWRSDVLLDLHKLIHIPCPCRLYMARVDEVGRRNFQLIIRERFDKLIEKGRLIHASDKFWVILFIITTNKDADRYVLGGISHRGRFEWSRPKAIKESVPDYSGFET